MNGRPAGMSDEDEDEDDDDYFLGYPRRRVRLPPNGGPKSLRDAISNSNILALEQYITLAQTRQTSINHDGLMNDSPLILVCLSKWVDGVELLLRKGADPNVKKELTTPLAICCYNSCTASAECAKFLLEYGADVNVKNQHGEVPLIIAAQRNSLEVMKVLLDSSNIDKNITDPLGRTALFHAYASGNDLLADLLITAGINTQVRDKYSKLAKDLQPTNPPQLNCPTFKVSSFFENSDAVAHYRAKESVDALDNQKIITFLNRLPDRNGNGGFSDLVQHFLEFASLPELALNNCQLPDLLLGDEETLAKSGVQLSHQRQRILRAAHRFHCCRWDSSSILDLKNDSLLSTEGIGQIIANILMHLVSMRCSLLYLRSRIVGSAESSNLHKDYVIKLVELYGTQITIKNKLESILDQIYKMKSISDRPIDHVGRSKNNKQRQATFKFFSVTLSILSLSYLYFFAKKHSM